MELGKAVEFIPFDSPRGKELLEAMNKENNLLKHLTTATQKLSRERYLFDAFGEDVVIQAHREGLTTRHPQGFYSITLKGRDLLGKRTEGKAEALLVEFAAEEVKEELLRHLKESISEEKAAIDVYRIRANYARRGYPTIALLYDHIREEEEHHLKELLNMVNQLTRR